MKWRATLVFAAALMFGLFSIQPAGAQDSAGGCGSDANFPGATSTDSDGDGVTDAAELAAGTDVCVPDAPAPTTTAAPATTAAPTTTAAPATTAAPTTTVATTTVCGVAVANYNAATADTDGDGFTDAAEIAAGTDQCDSSSVISAGAAQAPATTAAPTTTVCGVAVANYNAATADTDGDGQTDAAEIAAGTDQCDSASVNIPELALTGPSTAMLGFVVALAMVVLGAASLAVGRRVEA